MRPLDKLVIEYLSGLAASFYIRQCLVIVALFVFGALLIDLLIKKEILWIRRLTLAFPVGLSAFVITAYAMMIIGIPYTSLTVCVALFVITAPAVFLGRRTLFSAGNLRYKKHMLMGLAAVILIALAATSGIAPVSVSNDTMYYFRRYPDAIVFYKGLRDQFDFFMTDTGLGAVAIDTLPALFGFGETFGIREFFHIDFMAFFGLCIYERAEKKMSKRSSVAAALLITAFLGFSTPFVILGHWALANMYFMELFFIAAYTVTENDQSAFYANCLLMIALSMLRIEGTLFVIWLAVCNCAFTDLSKKVATYVLLPITLLFGGYCLRIYTMYDILDNQYTFLSPQKAILLVCLLAASAVFMYLAAPLLHKRLGRNVVYLYLLMLVAGNLLMFVRDINLYIGNLNAFYANLFRQSGWGMLPYFIIAMTAFLAAEYLMKLLQKKKPGHISGPNLYNITMVVGFILIVLAASYGRGDVLDEEVGDSGNRVLLQIVPLLVMTYGELFINLIADPQEKESPV